MEHARNQLPTFKDLLRDYPLKANAKEHRHEYDHQRNKATLPEDEKETSTRSTLYKTRSWTILFRNRRLARKHLITQCRSHKIRYRRIPLDGRLDQNFSKDSMVIDRANDTTISST